MGMPLVDMTGFRSGRLVVIERGERKDTSYLWVCRCDCGATVQRSGGGLRLGQTLSCGCLRAEKLVARNVASGRGRMASGEYERWRSMIRRCYQPSHSSYKDYGALGITVCERWRDSFEAFLADMGPRPAGATIDRKDNSKGYEPENCRWADAVTQATNRRNVRAVIIESAAHSIPAACMKTGVNYGTAMSRIRRGWDATRAVTQTERGSRWQGK